jgi:probable F420-dependent oxidoreductase
VRLTLAPWGASIRELVEVSARAEQAGAEAVWVPELHRSSTVPLAALAAGTSTVTLGTAISLAFVRSPMVTALEALDLDEISDGRLVLGLGTGVQRLNELWHNARWGKPVAHLRETVRDVRHFVRCADTGEDIDLPGEFEPMRISHYQRPFPPRRREIPIYLASTGPAMTRLTGEVGDGWIAHELGSPGYLEQLILPNLLAGAEKAGRGRADLDVVASACCVPWHDGRQARRWAAGLVAFYATVRTYEPFFEFHGFLEQARNCQAAFRAGDERALVDAVPDEMVDALTLAGTPDEVRERLARYDGLADAIKLSPPTHYVGDEVTRAVQEQLVEMVAAARPVAAR